MSQKPGIPPKPIINGPNQQTNNLPSKDCCDNGPELCRSNSEPGNSFWNVPNTLCVVRIFGSIVLIGIALANLPCWFVGLYLIFAASDLIDGPLARWLGQQSNVGAAMDSIADILLSLSLIIGALIFSGEMLQGEYLLIGLAIASYGLAALTGYSKFGRLPSFHTYSAKVTHLLVAIAGVSLVLQWSIWPFRVAACAVILANIESMLISFRLKEWQTDIPSVFGLYRTPIDGDQRMGVDLFEAARQGDIGAISEALKIESSLEIRNEAGRTPLMVAVESKEASLAAVQFLLDQGADPNGLTVEPDPIQFDPETLAILKESGVEIPDPSQITVAAKSVLAIAAQESNFEKIEALIRSGADVQFVDENGYAIFVFACYGAFNRPFEETRDVFYLLKESGASFPAERKNAESVVSVLSTFGHFGLLKVVLDLGASPESLGWTPLFHAIAFEGRAETERILDEGGSLEDRDSQERTPFLVAVVAGNLEVAQLLVERGAKITAKGRVGQSAMTYAVEGDHADICNWLIELGCDLNEKDEFNNGPLQVAVNRNAVQCVQVLVDAGADVFQRDEFGFGLLHDVESTEMFELLEALGVNTNEACGSVRRALTGGCLSRKLSLTQKQFERHRNRIFGDANPQKLNNAYWDEMVRTRQRAYDADRAFGHSSLDLGTPAWCFDRSGHSFTRLPNGTIVEIGGEHEDHYDPDFCIYNDVVVHNGNGEFEILGYPQSIFPPTDFHTATYLKDEIFIIGSLGYPGDRRIGETPVYVLNCLDWSIKKMSTSGQCPGWIGSHTARLMSDHMIGIRFGKIATDDDLIDNHNEWSLNVVTGIWTKDVD